jgi:hypothetical protein
MLQETRMGGSRVYSPQSSRSVRTGLLPHLLAAIALSPCLATAQPVPEPAERVPDRVARDQDKVAAELERARIAYEATMSRVRKSIDTALERKLAEAERGKSPDADRIAVVSAEQAAFLARGEWPDVPNLVTLRNDAAKAASRLQDAYAKAMSGYTSAKNDALVKVIKAELDEFGLQRDIVPWSGNLISDLPKEARTLQSDDKGAMLSVNLAADTRLARGVDDEVAEYRIEIRGSQDVASTPGQGQAAEKIASLVVDLPLAASEGKKRKRIALPAQEGRDGEYRVMLTVRNDFVGCDRGVARPVSLTDAVEDTSPEPMQLILTAHGGTSSVEIDSVVVKPVVEGKPEFEQVVGNKEREQRRKEPQPERLNWAGHWTGQFDNAQPGQYDATATAKGSNKEVTFTVKTTLGDRRWSFRIRDNQLELVDMEAAGRTTGNKLTNFETISSSVQDGKISWTGTWTFSRGSDPGVRERVALTLTRR